MHSNNCVNPILSSTASTCDNKYYYNEKVASLEENEIRFPHLHQACLTIGKARESVKTYILEKRDQEKRPHEKRPQDGKTNPME